MEFQSPHYPHFFFLGFFFPFKKFLKNFLCLKETTHTTHILYPSSHTGMKSEQYLRPSDRVNLHWRPLDVVVWKLRGSVLTHYVNACCFYVECVWEWVGICSGCQSFQVQDDDSGAYWAPPPVGRMPVLRLPRLAAFFVALSPPGASRSLVRIVVCSQISESVRVLRFA
jgi:hypothetical protein